MNPDVLFQEFARVTREYFLTEKNVARVGPSVPCVAPTGSTAERCTGTVLAAERPDGNIVWDDGEQPASGEGSAD